MKEHHIVVSRTARYHTLGQAGRETRQLWYLCHGYGAVASEFLAEFSVLDDGSRLLVAPEALSRFYTDHDAGKIGASWMTREDRDVEINDYVRYLDLLHQQIQAGLESTRVSVHLLGFSQGVHTALRWVTRGMIRVDRLILWGALCPPDVDPLSLRRGLGHAELIHVSGDRDRFAGKPALEEWQSLLAAHGINSIALIFNGGHRIDRATLLGLGDHSPVPKTDSN